MSIGQDVAIEEIQKDYDAVYIAIGAHVDKKLGLEGEESSNVISAVELLRVSAGKDIIRPGHRAGEVDLDGPAAGGDAHCLKGLGCNGLTLSLIHI